MKWNLVVNQTGKYLETCLRNVRFIYGLSKINLTFQ